METNTLTPEMQDKAEAEDLLASLGLPPEIDHVEVSLGVDSTGDPAMWVRLWIRKDLAFDEVIAKRLNQTAEEVQLKLMQGSFHRFPYTTLDQAA